MQEAIYSLICVQCEHTITKDLSTWKYYYGLDSDSFREMKLALD